MMIRYMSHFVKNPASRAFTWIWVLPVLLLACNDRKNGEEPTPDTPIFKIAGYLFAPDQDWQARFAALSLEGVTDLNLAFIDPNVDGEFSDHSSLTQVIRAAHDRGMRVYFSIGGGDPPPHLANLIRPDKRAAFAASIAAFAVRNQLDGVDIDLENALINEDYAPFVLAVKKALLPHQKLMTAALASWNAHLIHDSTLAQYDAIHIMSYDKTGPWNPSQAGPHSPYSMAVDDLDYFSGARGVDVSKLSVGLPFYGYGFGNNVPASISFRDIAIQYPDAVDADEKTVPAGGTIYFNGKSTIRAKATLARQRGARGVMIWQLAGDAAAPHSLLKVINDVAKP